MNRPLDGIEALSFDLFDTLVDQRVDRLPTIDRGGRRLPSTAGLLHEHVTRVHGVELEMFLGLLQEVDRDLHPHYYQQGRELPTMTRFLEFVDRLGVGSEVDPKKLAHELCLLHMGVIRDLSELPPHHLAALARLRTRRPIALCSNFSHAETAVRICEEFGLREHLDVVVISEDVGIRKPRREIFDAVLEGLDVAPERVLHVGDRLRADVSGAGAIGMRTAWITRRVADPRAALAEHDGPAPDLVIEDLDELDALLGD